MRALVTGGAGFIGSNLVDALLDRGDEVAVVDDLSTGKRENLRAALRAARSFTRPTSATRGAQPTISRRGSAPSIVFHLAAQIDVRRLRRRPGVGRADQHRGHHQRAGGGAAGGAQRVINSSTGGAIYGETERPHARERAAPADGALRRRQVLRRGLLRLYAPPLRPLMVTLRYGNVYGPRQDPHGEAGVIAIFCGKLLEGGRAGDLRRRPPDARLRLRRRHRRGEPGRCGAPRGPRGVQRGHRHRGLGGRGARRDAQAAGLGEGEFEPEFAPPGRARCSAARSM